MCIWYQLRYAKQMLWFLLVLTGKLMGGHMEGDIRDSAAKEGIWNGAVVQHIILLLRKIPGRRAVGLTFLFQCGCLFFFSQQAEVAEELDLELPLARVSHRISSFRVKVLRRKQMLAHLRQSHSQSCMLSKQRLQPKCLPAAQKVWGSDRSSLLSSWARRSMGSTIHPSCTAGKGLAEEVFLAEASVEDQLC